MGTCGGWTFRIDVGILPACGVSALGEICALHSYLPAIVLLAAELW